ncbi:hypothetical protein Bhyg_12934 [Pseudolycoriella hygida]|uniref:Uncharacterized protein n=1 Tax=Pseudolycoriella hygida TaxID=35572 RepID=A0A9Q0RZT9_9DIPT|nr:hypothetical protein Bhyg_12934 [Pseudolycoriella hygida]
MLATMWLQFMWQPLDQRKCSTAWDFLYLILYRGFTQVRQIVLRAALKSDQFVPIRGSLEVSLRTDKVFFRKSAAIF